MQLQIDLLCYSNLKNGEKMKKIIILALICLLHPASGMEISSLRQIRHENSDTYADNSMRLAEIYSQPDGFTQWRADCEWLMSEEVVEGIFADQVIISKNLGLLSVWITKVTVTHAFDEIWAEDIRDSAIPLMEQMINVYQVKTSTLQDGDFKTSINSLINDLIHIKKYFDEVIDYRYGDEHIITIEKSTGNMIDYDHENGPIIIENVND